MRHSLRDLARALVIAGVLLAVGRPVGAAVLQRGASSATLQGTVRDEDGRGVVGAQLGVIGNAASGESGDGGRFSLSGLPDGIWRLQVRRMGFFPETLGVAIASGTAPIVSVTLRRLAIAMAPVKIYGRRDLRGVLSGFYERLEAGHGGHFLTREQLEQRPPGRLSDVLRGIPGVRIEQRRGGATSVRVRGTSIAPTVFLNGVPLVPGAVELDAFDPRSFEGIEIYSGAATVPVQFMGGRGSATSGTVIVLWTREGEARPRRPRRGDPTPARRVTTLMEERLVFSADEVDVVAQLRSGARIRPVYPESLYRHGVPGHVVVEFVVDTIGRVQMETFGTVSSTHASLAEAVRRAIDGQRFVPARRGGRTVAQLVQQPFDFVPDSGSGERKPKE